MVRFNFNITTATPYDFLYLKSFILIREAVDKSASFIGVALLTNKIAEFTKGGVWITYKDGTRHFLNNNNFDKNGNRIYE